MIKEDYSEEEIAEDIQQLKSIKKTYTTLLFEFDTLRSKYMASAQYMFVKTGDIDILLTKMRNDLADKRGE